MDENLIQGMIILMDMNGWEQDGHGPTFVNVAGNGERRRFRNWDEVCKFVMSLS